MSTLPRLPPVSELIKIYGLTAKSQLSQNFILDKNITDKIARSAQMSASSPLVIEVGPGPGLLTRSILDTGARNVVAVEKDRRFIPTLRQLSEASEGRLKVIQGDALRISHNEILRTAGGELTGDPTSPLHIIGNLPFNVASPLLIQWLHMLAGRQGIFSKGNVLMTLMFQKEVGMRIAARPSTQHRGRLSVMAQSLCSVKNVYDVPSKVFVPQPKVNAAVMQLKPEFKFPEDEKLASTFVMLEDVVRYFFNKRRKSMSHMLKRLYKANPAIEELQDELENFLDTQARCEDLTTEQFCRIAKLFHEHNIKMPVT